MNPSKEACAAAVARCACFNFAKASRSVTQLFNATLQPSGLRSTQFVLLATVYAEEPVSMTRLAQAVVVDRSTLARNLKPLEREGFVKTVRTPGARGNSVQLTARGRRKVADTIPLWEKAQAEFIESLGVGRWSRLLKGLNAAVDTKRTI